MTRQYVDRGGIVQGVERTSRDSRVPFQFPRTLKNFALPDGRLRRRPGFKRHLVAGDQALAKVTASVIAERWEQTQDEKHDLFQSPLSYALLRHHTDFQPKKASDWSMELDLVLGEKEHLVASATKFQRQCAASTDSRSITAHINGANHQITLASMAGLPNGLDPVFVRLSGITGAPDINGDYGDCTVTGGNIQINGLNTTGGGPYSGGTCRVLMWGSTAAPDAKKIRRAGVYVYDQAILSNHVVCKQPDVAGDQFIDRDYNRFETVPLTAMAIGYNEDEIFLYMDLFNTVDSRYELHAIEITSAIGTYTVGDTYNLAVTFDADAGAGGVGQITFFVNGSSAGTYDLTANQTFCGIADEVNGLTTPLNRDIVLLNEFCVRGHYNSSCKVALDTHGHQVNSHTYFDGDAAYAAPWALSPPKGTMLKNLRWWNKELSSSEVNDNIGVRLATPYSANLKGYWLLNDGTGVCKDLVNERHITVHHGYPSYVTHDEILHNIGLSIADGQHIIASFSDTDDSSVADVVANLKNTFGLDERGEDTGNDQSFNYQSRHNFTAMIQFRTPYSWQQELNRFTGATNNQGASAGGEPLRDFIDSSTYKLYDGKGAGNSRPIHDGHLGAVDQSFRAHDATLFSIEGTAGNSTGESDGDLTRIPLLRCVLTPDGYVAFEVYKLQGDDSVALENRMYRVSSQNPLDLDDTYTVVCKQEAIPDYDAPAGFGSPGLAVGTKGIKFTLHIQKLSDSGMPVTIDTFYEETRVESGSDKCRSSMQDHVSNYDIIVGASQVNSGWDSSISAPTDPSPTADYGPWQVPQHFMSCYQDQPGFFLFGFFRLWTSALSDGEITKYAHSSISRDDYIPSLVVNWEVEEVSGPQLVNKCRYPFLGQLGYKGWGAPEARHHDYVLSTTKIKSELYPGAWPMEDGLGYLCPTGTFDDYPKKINGLIPYQSTLRQSFGMLAIAGDSILLDNDLTGDNVKQIGVQNHGLLNDFVGDQPWYGTVIGERTFLTSRGGLTKVFNGRNCLVAGFKRWTGGNLLLRVGAGALEPSKWYGVRAVYFSEENSIEHISPVAVLQLGAGDGGINVYQVPPHYDPRVTSIRFYRTLAQETKEFARTAPLFQDPGTGVLSTKEGVFPNAFLDFVRLATGDSDLLSVPLDLTQTEFPVCAFSASHNGKLFLGGDLLEPDAVFITDAGNPERIDVIDQKIVLEESSGDRQTGMIAAFNAVFVFKANSTWRVDDLGGNQYQVSRLASVGAVSPESIALITIPDTGRSVITFWSQHGPYLFDGSGFQYIGGPIEEPPSIGPFGAEFDWLEPESVMSLHDVRRREILFFYKPRVLDDNGDRNVLARRSEAAVYNYRYNSWYFYSELLGSRALALSFTGNDISSYVVSGKLSDSVLSYFNEHKLFLGAENGAVYEWSKGSFDGQDDVHTSDSLITSTVFSYSAGTSTITLFAAPSPDFYVQNLWVTVRQSGTNLTFSRPIKRGSGGTALIIDNDYFPNTALPFTPSFPDEVIFFWSPAVVQLPWDELGVPFTDKMVSELITWHDQLLYFRSAIDYVETYNAWTQLTDSASQRKRTPFNRRCEALKLELMTLAQDAELDAIAYLIDYTQGANTVQP